MIYKYFKVAVHSNSGCDILMRSGGLAQHRTFLWFHLFLTTGERFCCSGSVRRDEVLQWASKQPQAGSTNLLLQLLQ